MDALPWGFFPLSQWPRYGHQLESEAGKLIARHIMYKRMCDTNV